MQSLSTSLEENKAYFQGRFAHSLDFITREFTLAGRKAALFAVDGLINKEIIALSVMEPLLKTQDYPPAPQAMLAHIERAVLSAAASVPASSGSTTSAVSQQLSCSSPSRWKTSTPGTSWTIRA